MSPEDKTSMNLHLGDGVAGLGRLRGIHSVVTDPPFTQLEFDSEHVRKRDSQEGGVWRHSSRIGGVVRRPSPRLTVTTETQRKQHDALLYSLGSAALAALRPGGHLIIAQDVLHAHRAFSTLASTGLEFRGVIHRRVHTLRGGGN